MNDPKFPNIEVDIVGGNGNAFSIMGHVSKEMLRGGLTKET